jgi:polyferredoxin
MTQAPPPTAPPPRDPLAALPRLDRHKPKCGPVRPSKSSRWRAASLVLVHVLVAAHLLHWGIAGRTVTPVEPSEAMQTLEAGKINAGFVFFLVAILGTLVFGRWFCGWACHVVALQDLSAWLLGKASLRPRPIRSRLLVLGPFLVGGYMFVWPQIERLWRPVPDRDWQVAFTTADFWETFPGWIMGPATFLVVGFLIVWWLGAKGFCTHGCPYAAFFALADRFAPGRIRVTDACDACGHCTSVCSSNVRVHEEVAIHKMIVDPGCMKCLDCVSVCPKDALYYGFTAPKPFAVSQQRRQARADFTWPEELLLLAVAFAGMLAFRRAWFGEGVPFLLSVGLGVITAVAVLLFVRLLVRKDVTFQHTVLKSAGVRTRRGNIVLAGLGVWMLFTLHTGIANLQNQRAAARGLQALADVVQRRRDVPPAEWQAAADALAQAEATSLLADPHSLGLHGLVLRAMGRHAEALRQLRRARDVWGVDHFARVMRQAAVALATYEMDRAIRDFEAARALVDAVLEHTPDDASAKVVREALQQVAPR